MVLLGFHILRIVIYKQQRKETVRKLFIMHSNKWLPGKKRFVSTARRGSLEFILIQICGILKTVFIYLWVFYRQKVSLSLSEIQLQATFSWNWLMIMYIVIWAIRPARHSMYEYFMVWDNVSKYLGFRIDEL